MGQNDNAMVLLQEGLSINKEHLQKENQQLKEELQTKTRIDKAEKFHRKALEIDPESVPAYVFFRLECAEALHF